jgi:hypothetical protein
LGNIPCGKSANLDKNLRICRPVTPTFGKRGDLKPLPSHWFERRMGVAMGQFKIRKKNAKQNVSEDG